MLSSFQVLGFHVCFIESAVKFSEYNINKKAQKALAPILGLVLESVCSDFYATSKDDLQSTEHGDWLLRCLMAIEHIRTAEMATSLAHWSQA